MKIVIHRHCRFVNFKLIIVSKIQSIENSGHHWIQGYKPSLDAMVLSLLNSIEFYLCTIRNQFIIQKLFKSETIIASKDGFHPWMQ